VSHQRYYSQFKYLIHQFHDDLRKAAEGAFPVGTIWVPVYVDLSLPIRLLRVVGYAWDSKGYPLVVLKRLDSLGRANGKVVVLNPIEMDLYYTENKVGGGVSVGSNVDEEMVKEIA
jgi:hypothetical protein